MKAPFNGHFRLHDPEVILTALIAAHPQRSDLGEVVERSVALLPADYLCTLRSVGECAIASDFVFLGPRRLHQENTSREAPAAKREGWWIFGTSGTGDAWLIRRHRRTSEVAFLDHDEESSAKPRSLPLTFGRWLQLADLMSQVEKAQDTQPALLGANQRLRPSVARDVRALMNGIVDGLAKRFPYSVG